MKDRRMRDNGRRTRRRRIKHGVSDQRKTKGKRTYVKEEM